MPRLVFATNSEDLDRLMRGITFIIENEGWTIIECDWTSVEGISYMSLTESKVNYEYDDRIVDVAELDRLTFPTLKNTYTIGDIIIPEFNNSTFNEWQIVLIEPELADGEEPCVVRDENNHLKAVRAGTVTIKMRLKNLNVDDPKKAVTKEFEINIYNTNDDALYIDGPDFIRLDRYESYTLRNDKTNDIIFSDVNFYLSDNISKKIPIVTISNIEVKEIEDDSHQKKMAQICTLHANGKNEIGEAILNATYNGKTYTKAIKIVPLW